MLLSCEEENSIRWIASQDPAVVEGFCKQTIELIVNNKKLNSRMYNSASKKLGVTTNVVADALSALISLVHRFSESTLTKDEQMQYLHAFNLSPQIHNLIMNLVNETTGIVSQYMRDQRMKIPTLTGLDWRIDVVAANRAAHSLCEPLVTLQLHTNHTESLTVGPEVAGQSNDSLLLQTDAVTLRHVTSVLEDALQQARTPHHLRIQRALY